MAVWIEAESLDIEAGSFDPGALWRALGAMQEFAEASGGAWFEFDGDFARWCRESGHAHALDPEQVGVDEARPSFAVAREVNRSGRQLAPRLCDELEERRLYWIDDVAGRTGRMHVVGVGELLKPI